MGNKNASNVSYVVLGIVAVIAVIGLIMLFKAAMSAALVTGDVPLVPAKVYGGAIKGFDVPYFEDRVVIANMGNSVDVVDTTGLAYRRVSAAAEQNRDPARIVGLMDTCEGLIVQDQLPEGYIYEAGWNDAVSRYGLNNCIDMRDWISQLCCKRS